MDIIAQEFKTPGNIGAVARVMKNFGFTSLVLLNPQCDHLGKEALDRATHAKDILQNARVVITVGTYDTLVGTTATLGRDYNLRRNTISPEALAKMHLKENVGIVIGREGDGMTNAELEACDIVVNIPCTKKYPEMNVSHAATILLYEIFKHSGKEKTGDNILPATREQKDRLLRLIIEKTAGLHFTTGQKRKTQASVWKKVIGKSNLSRREAMALFGFFRKIK